MKSFPVHKLVNQVVKLCRANGDKNVPQVTRRKRGHLSVWGGPENQIFKWTLGLWRSFPFGQRCSKAPSAVRAQYQNAANSRSEAVEWLTDTSTLQIVFCFIQIVVLFSKVLLVHHSWLPFTTSEHSCILYWKVDVCSCRHRVHLARFGSAFQRTLLHVNDHVSLIVKCRRICFLPTSDHL